VHRSLDALDSAGTGTVTLPAVHSNTLKTRVRVEEGRGGFSKRYLTLFGGEIISKLCVFAAFAYLARVLGPSGFGLIELALSITLFFVMSVDGGLGSYGARVVSARPEEAPRLLAQITVVRAAAAAIAYVPLLLGSLFYGMPGAGMLAVYGLAVFFVPFFNQWLFQGFRAMHLVAAGTTLRNVVFASVVFAAVRPGADLRTVAIAEVAGVAALAAFTTIALRRVLRIHPDRRGLVRGAVRMLRESWPLGASEVTWAALWYSPGIVLGALSTSEQMAWLAGPLRIVLALHTFVWLYFFNLLPALSRSLATADEDWRNLTKRSLRTSMWLACLVALSGTLFAPFIVQTVYGPAYSAAALPLQIVIWMIPLAWFSGHFRYSLIAAGEQRWEFYALAATVVVTVFGTWALSPEFGAIGAAMSLVAGGVINGVLAWLAVAKRVGTFDVGAAVAGSVVSCLVCLLTGLIVGSSAGLFAGAATALACYLVIAARCDTELMRLARVWLQR
jgi:polysaccharide transporter, PST family